MAERLVPSPNYAIDQTLFSATQDSHLQKSIDGGASWTPILTHTISALAISPVYGASQKIYAAAKDSASSPAVLYRSDDGGATWVSVTTGIPDATASGSLNITSLIFAADGSVLLGVTYGDGTSGAVAYRSIDDGATWVSLGSGLEAYQLFDVTSTANAFDSAEHGGLSFFAATSGGLWRTDRTQHDPTEPGAWASSGPRGGSIGLLAPSPNFANDGIVFTGQVLEIRASEYGPGLIKSSNWGQTWRSVSKSTDPAMTLGGEAVHAYTFSPNFANDHLVYASTSGGLYKSTDSGETWQVMGGVYSGFPGGVRALVLAPDYLTSGHMIATGGWNTLVMSRNNGQSWVTLPVTMSGEAVFSPNYAVDGTIFASGNNIYRSLDRGLSWTQILPAVGHLALSPQFGVDHVAFLAYSSAPGVSKTIDSGLTWLPVLSDSVRIFLSPQYGSDQTIFGLSNGGSSPYGWNVLYRSPDGGATWITTTIGLTSTSVSGLIFSPAFNVDHLMYATASDGLYQSSDGGLELVGGAGLCQSIDFVDDLLARLASASLSAGRYAARRVSLDRWRCNLGADVGPVYARRYAAGVGR